MSFLKIGSCLTVTTLHLHYKEQSVHVVWRNNCSLLRES